jgi:hypothetical protein
MKKNDKAWNILTDEEKLVLNLTAVHGKSSWEIGEIVQKAHFKLLEIQKRCVKFFEMFTTHYETYGELFSEESVVGKDFREYFQGVMELRLPVKEAIRRMFNNDVWSIKESRTRLITEGMDKLMESRNDCDGDLYNLIKEFDAWNNFRVLPDNLQEPSAYKRRNKAREAKHLRNISKIPMASIEYIKDLYEYNGKYQKMFLPLIHLDFPNGYILVPVRYAQKNIKALSHLYLYVFDNETLANNFAGLVVEYLTAEDKSAKSGQKFWPKFRDIRQYAINFQEIENVNVFRKHVIARIQGQKG